MSELRDTVSPWLPDPDPRVQRRMGKTIEECGELIAVAARVQIQGLHAVDPSSGRVNRHRLVDEIADVLAQCDCCLELLSPELRTYVADRREQKVRAMRAWEGLVS